MTIKAGTIVTFEEGEFEYHHWFGPFRVLKDINREEAVKEFLESCEERKITPCGLFFSEYLRNNGYLGELKPTHMWNLGLGKFDPEF